MSRRRVSARFVAILALGFLAGCLDDAKNDLPFDPVENEVTGCLMGVVYDGLHNDRVDLAAAKIYLVSPSKVVAGSKTATILPGAASAAEGSLVGEYILCGVPFGGGDLPVYIEVEGYQRFSALVNFPLRVPNRSESNQSGFWNRPTKTLDVKVFKLQDLIANEFTVTVTKAGALLPSANVILEPRDLGTGDPLTRIPSQTATTAETGIASFDSTKLAFGQRYALHIYDPAPDAVDGNSGNHGLITKDLILGQAIAPAGAITTSSIFSIDVDLTIANQAPALVTSTQNGSIVSTGVLTLVFDREIAVDSLSIQAVTYGVSALGHKPPTGTGGYDACVAADIGSPVAGTDPPVTVAISGTIATITPSWTAAPTVGVCQGVQVQYDLSGLQFYSKAGAQAVPNIALGNYSVFLSSPAP
jgi:hypothetical protein